jgi:hypothetical protein
MPYDPTSTQSLYDQNCQIGLTTLYVEDTHIHQVAVEVPENVFVQ